MGRICKKCGYERQDGDFAPEYECPKCGAVYAKVEARLQQEAERMQRQKAKEVVYNNKDDIGKDSNNTTYRKKKFGFTRITARLPKSKAEFLGTLLFIVILIGGLYVLNYLMLGKQMVDVVNADQRNTGVSIAAHYKWYVQPSILVINVNTIPLDKSPADIFRVLLQYSSRIKAREFDAVLLQSNGKTKFVLKGDYFRKLGKEYGDQNPVYTMRTFTENVYTPEGIKAFSSWSGGLIGVVTKQIEDFTEFHKRWYVEDM